MFLIDGPVIVISLSLSHWFSQRQPSLIKSPRLYQTAVPIPKIMVFLGACSIQATAADVVEIERGVREAEALRLEAAVSVAMADAARAARVVGAQPGTSPASSPGVRS